MPKKFAPPNPIIQNYLNDESIPIEKINFAISELDNGVPEEKIATAITTKYGNMYLPDSRMDESGKEMSISEYEQKKSINRGGSQFQSAGKNVDLKQTELNKKKQAIMEMFGAPSNIIDRVQGVKEGFTDAMDRAATDWKEAKTDLGGGRGFLDFAAAGGNLLSSPISAAAGFFKPEIEKVVNTVDKSGAIDMIVPKKIRDLVSQNTPESIKSAATDALEATGLLGAPVGANLIKNAIKTVKAPVKIAGSGVKNVISSIGGGMNKLISPLYRKATGFSEETMNLLKNEPHLYKAVKENKISDQTLADEVFQALEKKAEELSTTGGKYEKIRTSTKTAPVPKQEVVSSLEKRGIKIDENGELNFKGSNIATQSDKNAIKSAVYEIMSYSDEITGNDFLNLRSKLDDYINYESQVSAKAEDVVKNLRREVDKNAKLNFEGLSELDASYGPLVKEFKQLKKDYFKPEGGFKDNAISKITNLTKKGKEQILSRLEEVSPGITDKIRAFSAFEDVKYAASGRPIGNYLSAGIATGALSGNVPLAIGVFLSNPSIAPAIIMTYGKMLKIPGSILNSIKKKISSGTKLNPIESKEMTRIIEKLDSKLASGAVLASNNNSTNPSPSPTPLFE